MVSRRVVVTGKVQGVAFRHSCRKEAHRRHVTGWVANRTDGAVEAVFEGAAADVEAMVTWTRSGPSWAVVTGVEVSEEPMSGAPGFRVLARPD